VTVMKGLDDYIMGVHIREEDTVLHRCSVCKEERYIRMSFDMGGWFYDTRDEDKIYCEKCKYDMDIVKA